MTESRSTSAETGIATTAAGSCPGGQTSDIGTGSRCEQAEIASSRLPVILVAEDDTRLREVIVAVLRLRGFCPLPAPGGAEALALMQEHDGPIDLVLADVVMPGMSGPALAEAAQALQPGLPVLLMTGGPSEDEDVLRKPFSMDLLVRTVRARIARQLGPSPESP